MKRPLRWVSAVLGCLVLGLAGAHAGRRAAAEDPGTLPQRPDTWIYDLRVVRVDPPAAEVVETAPRWKSSAAPGDTTTMAWADLLAGLEARGRTTILLDQRGTALEGGAAEFKQLRRRSVTTLRTRGSGGEHWETSFVETGTRATLMPGSQGLEYTIEVSWESAPQPDGIGSSESVSWKGTTSSFASGDTLVLFHGQQQGTETPTPRGTELHVFVTGTRAGPR